MTGVTFNRSAELEVLPKFPYSVMYRPLKQRQGIRVLAVAHHKRRPEYWAGRR